MDIVMTRAGLIIYLLIVGISHIAFGIFSSKYRFNKPITIICYILLMPIFALIAWGLRDAPKYRFALLFLAIFSVYIVVYLILSKGSILKNLFLVTTYLAFVIIYFGVTFATCFIEGFAGYQAVRWCIILPVFAGFQALIYLVMIPQFKKTEINIHKGWFVLLMANVLYVTLIFMQIFWPFHLQKENLWTLMSFLICSFEYCLIFIVVFHGFSTTLSYNIEKSKNDELEKIAKFDSLTKLYNRYYFQLFCDSAGKVDNVFDHDKVAVIVMDINKFKDINDNFGHARGDEVLKGVASELQNCFYEEIYTCFRFGGDEFVVTVMKADKKEIESKIKDFKDKLKNNLDVSIAIGVAMVNYTNIDPIMTAFKKADKFMYQDKMER